MSEKIAVDIDDTLYSFGDLAREMMCDMAAETGDESLEQAAYSLNGDWKEWRTPPDVMGLDQWIEIIAESHKPERILSRAPYHRAPEVLATLAEHNELLYISNRDEEAYGPTVEWLDKCGFPKSEVICTQKPKAPFVADCKYLIDDRPKTLVQFVYDCDWKRPDPRIGFGLYFNYNSSLTDVPRINLAPNWSLLTKFFNKEGLLTSD